VVARVAVAIVAVLAIAWLGVMERDERMVQRGVQASKQGERARAERSFRDARLLNPDSAPDVLRSFLYLGANRRAEAKALVEDVVRREPDNLTAWFVLFRISQGTDPALERRALAARRRLDPVNARR
jgi:Tfp pilus assembly protein PilF